MQKPGYIIGNRERFHHAGFVNSYFSCSLNFMIRVLLLSFFLLLHVAATARDYTEAEGRAAWDELKRQPITEKNFRLTCDLMQDIGRTNLKLSYEILSEYVPMVKASQNRQWLHVLMMGWAKAKESTGYFEDAEKLYREICNSDSPNEKYYREAIVAITLMYGEWGKIDSLDKYVRIGEKLCREADDKEDLSFLYGFKAMTSVDDTAAMRQYFERAIALATDIPDKNALFTARYNYAYAYLQNDLQQQVKEFESLLELAKDPSLNHYPRKLYERTNFTFRNAGPSVYYNLMQINLLLTDYNNAWKFAELFYNATIKPNPASINAPYFDADMAIAKAYQNDFGKAKDFLNESRAGFKMSEDSIPYLSYFIAAGMLAENTNQYDHALHYFAMALKKGNTQSQHMIPPEIYYVHALIQTHHFADAEKILAAFHLSKDVRKYTVIGLNYYKYEAELLKAQGDYSGYGSTLETYYAIKDSLTNLNRYRAIQQMQTAVLLQKSEQEVAQLNMESEAKAKELRRERVFYSIIIGFTALTIILLILYLRIRQAKSRQREILQQSRIEQMEKQRDLELMRNAMIAEENERKKIADQLHDEVSAMLALASLNVSSTLEKGRQDEQAEKKLQKTGEILMSVTNTIRDLSHRLTPLLVEKFGFRKAIEDLVETVNLSEKLKMEAVIIGFEDTKKYQPSFLNDLYRIIQELLHNIFKHANASKAMMELVEHEDHISLIIEDNGAGITDMGQTKGKGLDTIKSKIAYFKGRMEITRRENKGTLITIENKNPAQ